MIPAQRRSCSVPLCEKNGPFVTSGLDRQDGEGVEKRLLASILFTAAFDVLDRITDEDQRKALARRVHAGAYDRMVGNKESGFSTGNEGPGQDAGPSPGAGLHTPGPRPPR